MTATPALVRARAALALIPAQLPYLSGLVPLVRLQVDARCSTASIFASGRLLVSPDWFAALSLEEAVFVIAHEILHLALQTHARAQGADREAFNIAHDYIINDMLAVALGRSAPAGGLVLEGARHRSAEALAAEYRGERTAGWRRPPPGAPDSALADALRAKGFEATDVAELGEVLDSETEDALFPMDADGMRLARAAVSTEARRSERALKLEFDFDGATAASTDGWDGANQKMPDGGRTTRRTYHRPSRRSGGCSDLVIPGRVRGGVMVNIVLDTSGSMEEWLPRVALAIERYSQGDHVEAVRLVQCDEEVTFDNPGLDDEIVELTLHGGRGSDLTPAFERLAADDTVQSALVITDGCVDFPQEPPPFSVVWAVPPDRLADFVPPYGAVLPL